MARQYQLLLKLAKSPNPARAWGSISWPTGLETRTSALELFPDPFIGEKAEKNIMKSPEDRRSPHVKRVSLAALVDICSQAGEGSPFQAESCNVSGRGMQVRTSFLPEIGEELVCRLNLDDEEVLVEGRVAWRAEGEDSGEFGVQFTALDADSAHMLQSLGEVQKDESQAAAQSAEFEEEEEAESDEHLRSGSRVRLHIDGLGAPMKACVHEGNQRKLRVGSSLEFLKVGRNLQVEDLGGGGSRGAQVDAVNVVINPATSVPELVVQLRYEGITPTPAPVEAQERETADYDDEVFAKPAGETAVSHEEHEELDDDENAPWEPAAEALRERLGGAVSSAGEAAQKATGLLGSLAQSARAQVAAVREKRAAQTATSEKPLRAQSKRVRTETRSSLPEGKRRVQSSRRHSRSAPSHLRSGIHDLGLASQAPRKQRSSQKSESELEAKVAPKRKLGAPLLFGAAFLVFAGSAVAFRGIGDSGEEVAASSAKAEESVEASKTDEAAKKVAQAPAKPEPEASVVAEVPLFGPQAMALKPAEAAPSRKDSAQAEKRAAAAAVADESWDEPAPVAETVEAKPWGRGRLYLPTIHRIRLDGAGASLSGAVNQDGFTVVVPGRKAMESGKAIQKRDKRIMAVETNNNSGGATVKFEFRGSVPPYRVRLRKDFLEFLISAPEETVARL